MQNQSDPTAAGNSSIPILDPLPLKNFDSDSLQVEQLPEIQTNHQKNWSMRDSRGSPQVSFQLVNWEENPHHFDCPPPACHSTTRGEETVEPVWLDWPVKNPLDPHPLEPRDDPWPVRLQIDLSQN